jgi:hypothetical protein
MQGTFASALAVAGVLAAAAPALGAGDIQEPLHGGAPVRDLDLQRAGR